MSLQRGSVCGQGEVLIVSDSYRYGGVIWDWNPDANTPDQIAVELNRRLEAQERIDADEEQDGDIGLESYYVEQFFDEYKDIGATYVEFGEAKEGSGHWTFDGNRLVQ